MTEIDTQALRTALPDRLETARLILRAPDLSDAPALAHLANNRKIHAMLTRLPHPYGEDNAITFISEIARGQSEQAYAIISREHGFIGVVSLIFTRNDLPEIGYWIGEPYWGQGFASEAAGALLAATLAIGPVSIKARARADNAASRNVLRKLGFTETGEIIPDCGPHAGLPTITLRLGHEGVSHARSA